LGSAAVIKNICTAASIYFYPAFFPFALRFYLLNRNGEICLLPRFFCSLFWSVATLSSSPCHPWAPCFFSGPFLILYLPLVSSFSGFFRSCIFGLSVRFGFKFRAQNFNPWSKGQTKWGADKFFTWRAFYFKPFIFYFLLTSCTVIFLWYCQFFNLSYNWLTQFISHFKSKAYSWSLTHNKMFINLPCFTFHFRIKLVKLICLWNELLLPLFRFSSVRLCFSDDTQTQLNPHMNNYFC